MIYNAILKDFGTLGDGLAGLLHDGVGVVLDGASEVVLVADFNGFVHRRSQPRHDWSQPLRVGIRGWKKEATSLIRVWNVRSENEKKVTENHNEHRPSLCDSVVCFVSVFQRVKITRLNDDVSIFNFF